MYVHHTHDVFKFKLPEPVPAVEGPPQTHHGCYPACTVVPPHRIPPPEPGDVAGTVDWQVRSSQGRLDPWSLAEVLCTDTLAELGRTLVTLGEMVSEEGKGKLMLTRKTYVTVKFYPYFNWYGVSHKTVLNLRLSYL